MSSSHDAGGSHGSHGSCVAVVVIQAGAVWSCVVLSAMLVMRVVLISLVLGVKGGGGGPIIVAIFTGVKTKSTYFPGALPPIS